MMNKNIGKKFYALNGAKSNNSKFNGILNNEGQSGVSSRLSYSVAVVTVAIGLM